MRIRYTLIIICILTFLTGCNRNKESYKKGDNQSSIKTWSPSTEVLSFWDGFNFADTATVNSKSMVGWMNSYIHLLRKNPSQVSSSIRHSLDIASKDSVGYALFSGLLKTYTYDPISPYRNDEWYIHVVEHNLQSDKTSEAERERANFRLEMLKKNRIGMQANDFFYTQADGSTNNLYSLKSENILLLFNNPGCEACGEVIGRMKDSRVVNRAISAGVLTILAFYPDEDLSLWEAHKNDIPENWINAYDKQQTVTNKKLYDLKAIPTLYLIGKNKEVELKDADFDIVERYIYQKYPVIMQSY